MIAQSRIISRVRLSCYKNDSCGGMYDGKDYDEDTVGRDGWR